jgi:hypothetical protein
VSAPVELDAMRNLVAMYRRHGAHYERVIGRLRELLRAENTDDALALVEEEYEAIHGPDDDDGREWPQAENE